VRDAMGCAEVHLPRHYTVLATLRNTIVTCACRLLTSARACFLQSRGVSRKAAEDFNSKRARQRAEDIAAGTREKGGRSIAEVPDDFLFLTRLVGLLRGLTAELDCSVPILYILALHAELGLQEND
jgi:hypothetical protein